MSTLLHKLIDEGGSGCQKSLNHVTVVYGCPFATVSSDTVAVRLKRIIHQWNPNMRHKCNKKLFHPTSSYSEPVPYLYCDKKETLISNAFNKPKKKSQFHGSEKAVLA